MANKIVQLHDEANNNIYPVTTLDAIHGSGALRADFVLKAGDTLTGPLTATKFIGPVQGNADTATNATSATTATKLATARTLTIGKTGKTFNGSSNVSWSHKEIGVLPITALTGTADVNSLTTSGWYNIYTTTATNVPTTNHALLLVGGEGDVGTKFQIFIPDSANTIYKRHYNNSNLAWGNWSKNWNIDISGNSSTASKLITARTIRTNLSSTTAPSFDGTANITPGVSGILNIANGGTGANNIEDACSNLNLNEVKKKYIIDLRSYSTSNYYFVRFDITRQEIDCEIASQGESDAFAYNQNLIHFLLTAQGWSDTPRSLIILKQGCHSPAELTIMSIVQGNHNGVNGVYLRGGLIYDFFCNKKPILCTSQFTSGDEVYTTGTTSYTNVTNASVIWQNNGSNRASWSVPLYGAVWNDYAEYRSQNEEIQPGYVVISSKNGKVRKTTQRLSPFDGVVSDTFGFAIGETNECKTPLAVAGRVLVYCEGSKDLYEIGDVVCASENGKACKMTREEICAYPDRIVGTVSEIPDYEEWGQNPVKVNGRIWIKVK